MADTKKLSRAEKAEKKAKEKVERIKNYAKNSSAEQLVKTYKLYSKVVIVFFVFLILSVFFRPWFYTVILAFITWRENKKKKEANLAHYHKTGEWIKEPKDPVKYMM